MNCYISKNLIKIYDVFLCFIIYSFCGWLMETVYLSVYHWQFIKRGFLISPLCGIYGIGTILVVFLLDKLKSRPVLVFFSSILITTVLELITGLFLQNVLKRELWDYSGYFFNFLGIICLRNTLIWGIMSLIAIYSIHPVVMKKIKLLSPHTKALISSICFVWISADLCISIFTSLQGINNIHWVYNLVFHRLNDIKSMTVKVVYYMRH
nr:putative ABC transporter permease [Ruminiclostridium josui]